MNSLRREIDRLRDMLPAVGGGDCCGCGYSVVAERVTDEDGTVTPEGVSATTWESPVSRFADKCNHLGVTP
jgi:hypothetical protein